MTTYYTAENANAGLVPPLPINGPNYRGKVEVIPATIEWASQASGSTIVLGELQPGERLINITGTQSATMGSSATMAIGDGTTVDKYVAAQKFEEAVNVELAVLFKHAPTMGTCTAKHNIVATIAENELPSSGTQSLMLWILRPSAN